MGILLVFSKSGRLSSSVLVWTTGGAYKQVPCRRSAADFWKYGEG
jgi:hypothetical protein